MKESSATQLDEYSHVSFVDLSGVLKDDTAPRRKLTACTVRSVQSKLLACFVDLQGTAIGHRVHSFETLPWLSEIKVCCRGLPWKSSLADFAYWRIPEQPGVFPAEL